MDALRSAKKTMRKATRKATRSVHEALHSVIDEEMDIQKALEHVAMEHEDSSTYVSAWAETTGDAQIISFASALQPLFRNQVEAEGALAVAQGDFVEMWKRLLAKERVRDNLRKTLDKNQANVDKLQTKLASAPAAKRAALEQKLAEATQLRDAAQAEYEPVAAETAAFTHDQLVAGYTAFNAAYIQYLQTCLNAANARSDTINAFAAGNPQGGGGIRAAAAAAMGSAAAYMPSNGAPPAYQ
ncbi:uncharacterized protein AMSG_03478 [Thecamonas trahens ATCC 50062]|uniref:BAR domain-containing protein n=1 Tax=Thecamonas trahens ATCC 50062 TaxID=461836 RepID=A0A0L0D6W5_THETB|nr:hypothetical protein AMSG_03478 [Thecamonas trahens ATCC 50062]KNC47053.1 hypothetical protein AMSG_03478 [Thecamonas trahens ATCC 50062]|eukprot:XP_013759833.1 hypothetical protein AMSG_03478 [Thecamonas trahens ATCC 50062]